MNENEIENNNNSHQSQENQSQQQQQQQTIQINVDEIRNLFSKRFNLNNNDNNDNNQKDKTKIEKPIHIDDKEEKNDEEMRFFAKIADDSDVDCCSELDRVVCIIIFFIIFKKLLIFILFQSLKRNIFQN